MGTVACLWAARINEADTVDVGNVPAVYATVAQRVGNVPRSIAMLVLFAFGSAG